MKIEFIADKVMASGPKIDGGYRIAFELSQEMQKQVALVMAIPQQIGLKVTIEVNDG